MGIPTSASFCGSVGPVSSAVFFLLHPKFLHEAPVEHQGAIVGSLHIVRCRYMVIFWVLG